MLLKMRLAPDTFGDAYELDAFTEVKDSDIIPGAEIPLDDTWYINGWEDAVIGSGEFIFEDDELNWVSTGEPYSTDNLDWENYIHLDWTSEDEYEKVTLEVFDEADHEECVWYISDVELPEEFIKEKHYILIPKNS